MSVLSYIFPICSGIISVTGLVTNALSLFYFAKKADRTLSNQVFIMLNVSDLFVSFFDVAIVSLQYCEGSVCGQDSLLHVWALAIIDASINSTAFATCILTMTRTISLCFPFYQINRKAVAVATLTFLAQEVLKCLLIKFYFPLTNGADKLPSLMYEIYASYSMIIMLSTVILLNLVSSILSVWKLLKNRRNIEIATVDHGRQAQRTNNNQKATVTILIVSFLFCFFNTVFCISLYFGFFEFGPETSSTHVIVLVLRGFAFWLAVPLNSAINPIVYFTRKRDMRKFIRGLLPNIACT